MKITRDGVEYERLFDVTRYPCPNGCAGSMYFTGADNEAPYLQCPFCHCVATPDSVEPAYREFVDVPLKGLV